MRALIASVLLFSSLCLGQGLGGADRPAFGGATLGAPAGQPQFLPIDQAYQLEVEIPGERQLRVYWQIAPEYYLYQHRFAFELTDADGAIPLDAAMPPALARSDEFFGEVQVYYDHADVPLQLARATEQARLTVSYQGCADAGLCYPPETRYFDIDFVTGGVTRAEPPRPDEAVAAGPSTVLNAGGLLYMLLLAFVGGSILNLMPCFFPILSLKVLGVGWFREFLGEPTDQGVHHPPISSSFSFRVMGLPAPRGGGDASATIIPSGPVGVSSDRSMPSSMASLRARGDTLRRPAAQPSRFPLAAPAPSCASGVVSARGSRAFRPGRA